MDNWLRVLSVAGTGAIWLAVNPAQATYMETCNALIEDWKSCGSNISACAAAEISLMTHCKCHELSADGTEWKIISNVTAIDDVCGFVPTMVLKKPRPPLGGGPPPEGGPPGGTEDKPLEDPPPGSKRSLPLDYEVKPGDSPAEGSATDAASSSAEATMAEEAARSASGSAVGKALVGGTENNN